MLLIDCLIIFSKPPEAGVEIAELFLFATLNLLWLLWLLLFLQIRCIFTPIRF